MAEQTRAPRLAVLIDADNASPKLSDELFKEIARIGEASVRRIYGDFSAPQMSSWLKVMPEQAIIPQMNIANTSGKNASDIALVIDAMDLLHSERFDGFCLVSSDSDFTRLAARIREQGLAVYGFGEKKTPKSFVQACQRFIYTENLMRAAIEEDATAQKEPDDDGPLKAAPLIAKAIEAIEDEEGWARLGPVGQQIIIRAPDFDPRSYGCAKLSELAEKSGQFDLERNPGRSIRIRAKVNKRRGARGS